MAGRSYGRDTGVILEEAGVEVGADIAGRQRVDADAEAGKLKRGVG
jgi:hypothetical protein